MAKNLVLLSDDADDATFLTEASQITDFQIQICSDAKKAIDYIATKDVSCIFINTDKMKNLTDFEAEAQKRFGLFSERIQAEKFHFIGSKVLSDNRDVIKSPFFSSYFQRPTVDLQKNAVFYARAMVAGEQKTTHDLKHFLDEKANIQKIVLTHTEQKQEAAEAVRQYLIKAKVPARISNVIANTLDELLMNAMFDAPVDDFGKHLYSATLRNQSRELTDRERVEMNLSFDGHYFGVSIIDQFGSLDRNRLVEHISMNYRNRDYSIRAGQAGAGLGLAAVFNSGGSLIYHCEKGQKTEVTLLYRVCSSYREFKSQFKFFSVKFYE